MKKLNEVKSVILSGTTNSIKGLEKYIGTLGYCTDHLDESIPLKIYTLEDIALGTSLPFAGSDGCYYKYFIPKGTAVFEEEPEEKKYRPYKNKCELPFMVGDVITIRTKDTNLTVPEFIEATVNEITYKDHIIENKSGEISYKEHLVNLISIGSRDWCDTQYLFDNFEILIDNKWQPFGVEE